MGELVVEILDQLVNEQLFGPEHPPSLLLKGVDDVGVTQTADERQPGEFLQEVALGD